MNVWYHDRHFFAKKFHYIIQAEAARRAVSKTPAQRSPELASATGTRKLAWRVTSLLRRRNGLSPVAEESTNEDESFTPREKELHRKVRTDMIRRMDAPPKRVDPNGWVSEGLTTPLEQFSHQVGSGGGQENRQGTEPPSSSDRIEPLMCLTSSPIEAIEVKDLPTEAEDPQMPLNACVIPGIVLYQETTLH